MFIPAQDSPGLRLDHDMRGDLAQSLERLYARASTLLPAEVDLITLCDHLRSHRVVPGVFARYFDLITSVQKQAWPSACQLWQEMADLSKQPAQFTILPFDTDALGADAERLGRFFTTGITSDVRFIKPGDRALSDLRQAAPAALSLLGDVHAAWAAEIRGLVTQLIAFIPAAGNSTSISGGSTMMAWGAVLINVGESPDRLHTLSVLAHEATHQFLFGLARSEPLVTNPVSERYSTELRPVPRPMNAFFHSTYVSGRLHALFEILRSRAPLSEGELAAAQQISNMQKRRFLQGCNVILSEGQLTPLGRHLIEEARDTIAGMSPPG